MAGLRGVKILLLWAGIIGLAKSTAPNASPISSNSNTTSPLTSPEVPQLHTTRGWNFLFYHVRVKNPMHQMAAPMYKIFWLQFCTTGGGGVLATRLHSAASHRRLSQEPTVTTTAPNASPISSNSNTTSPLTSPEVPQLHTTRVQRSTAPTLQCDYTVKPIQFGLQINIRSSAVIHVNATIMINEQGKPQTEAISSAPHSNQSSSHEIKQLKPCTKYELNVTLASDKHQPTPCINGNYTVTDPISEDDFKDFNCSSTSSKFVCYRTGWDISSLQTTPDRIPAQPCGNNTVCFKPGSDDICSNMTLTFSSCTNTTFQFNRSIPLGFLDVKSINQTAPTQFPAEFKAELPPNCKLSIDYTCRVYYDHEDHRRWFDKLNEARKPSELEAKKPSELEPFTNYSCIGHIKDNNVNVYNTTQVNVTIDCDLKIDLTKNSTTDTSSQLTWNTTSNSCKNVDVTKLSYHCSCGDRHGYVWGSKRPSGGTCNIPDLQADTDYTCKVQAYYNNYNYNHDRPTTVQQKTEIGVPEDIYRLNLKVKDHNTIIVTCQHSKRFNGPDGKFKAQLVYGSNVVSEKHNKKCEFEFDNLKYSATYKLKVTAANSRFDSKIEKDSISTEYNDKAVIGFLVFLIILTSVALLLVVYKILDLRRRKSHDLSENMILISTANDEENLLPVEPIAAELLLEAYKRKLADEARLFLAEFQSIPRIFSRHSVKDAKKSTNVPKNRYVDILPYDYNRVQLTTGNGEAGCDYINASFIDGYKEAKKYIAAQGPKDETLGDFWRMVWEQQSSIIVMVTRCEEGNRVKCSQYWPSPDREAEIFEEFIVKLNSEETCPDYTIRHLSLTNKREKNSEREVTHIQFMSWPDHGVPTEPHLLLKLRRRVNAFKNFFSGPIIVHCSAGVGRTGTYIGIDAMMEALEAEGRVDIYGYMVRLRRQRCLMVQVEAQYILIHQALVEHNQYGETEIPLSEVHSTLSTLTEKTSESEATLMEEEFDRVPLFHKWRTFNAGVTEENREKNRPLSVIPYDYNRVLLKIDEGRSHDSDPEDEEEESSDEEDEESCRYINATHINGYWGPRALIAAQTPLPDTMADFWLMVYQKRVSTLVMLSEENKESDTVYWDKDKRTFGDLEVEVVSTDTTPNFIRRNLMIRQDKRTESRSVKQFQFLKWANRELPETPQCLADMMKEIKSGGGGSKSQTAVVHCNDGSSRSGIFCALWNLLDCAQTEKVLDVFQVVKTLRKERQNMISSLEQYQFLYDTMQMVFPVQNGEVKAVQASAADSIQIISETAAAKQPDSAASSQQQEAAESTHLVAEEDNEEEPGKESSLMEDTSTVPLEV
ncbi:receptor-type tyrosine-protein phosphatase C [Hippoglossus hippoglossus]|uniref:receptor-type tyrosine-protein phosphatase C n=1 Tax=Hippoglossus hippoglossus TaxID=8267 RepID=UPI00148C1CFA|nr:receptor-type tyrosine-protein phosphatase C [Hippoglossus hippoglossus]